MDGTEPRLAEPAPQPDPSVDDCVNPHQIQFWIRDCEENHGGRCNDADHQSATPVTELRLIDVVDLCIVTAPAQARYFSLSYVWGGVQQMQLTIENCQELSVPGALQQYWSTIPATIQDAVQFVIALKERYLWVDSLCIVQNDTVIKHNQILQMGSIYNGAVACLIGAVGADAGCGLAGVRSDTRTPERRKVRYEDVYLIDPGPDEYTSLKKPWDSSPYVKLERRVKPRQLDLSDRLTNSHYNTRAWTFQERLLSRRCIYFMENMVYLNCRSAIRGENKATPYTQKTQDIRHLSLFKADPIFSGDPLRYTRTLGAIYAEVVKEFTRKELTFPGDILNSFSGIASTMGKLCEWQFIEGLPEQLFEYALLWLHDTKDATRRVGDEGTVFMSWSWAGWDIKADYDELVRTEPNYEPYLADMRSLIHQLHIYDGNSFRKISSLVPTKEKLSEAMETSLASGQQRTAWWLKRANNRHIPRGLLVFTALTTTLDIFRRCKMIL
jgi:hypothetical protein